MIELLRKKLNNFVVTLITLICLTTIIRFHLGKLIFVTLGAILCLGPAELTVSKIYYLIVLITLSLFSFFTLKKKNIFGLNQEKHTIMVVSGTCLFLALNTFNSVLHGFTFVQIIRGQTAVLIFLLGIPIAISSGKALRTNQIRDYAILLGVFTSISFWYIWSQNHGVANFQYASFSLSSEWTIFFGLALALNVQTNSRFRKLWYAASVILVGIFVLASLTRTNIIICLWIVLLSIRQHSKLLQELLKYSFMFMIGIWTLKLISPGFISNPAFIQRIGGSWNQLLEGGFSNSGLGSDQSFVYRKMQGELANHLFHENPFLGVGQLPSSQTFDTSYAVLAQYGLIGLALLILVFFQILQILRTQSSQQRRYVFAFFSAIIPSSLIYNWVESRSFWITMVLAIAFSQTRE